MLEIPTGALRSNSIDALRAGLLKTLTAGQRTWQQDSRDLMVALAPFHDCAARLGADPAKFFADVADNAPPGLADLVRTFGARTDITPAAFGFTVRQTPAGPEYAWA